VPTPVPEFDRPPPARIDPEPPPAVPATAAEAAPVGEPEPVGTEDFEDELARRFADEVVGGVDEAEASDAKRTADAGEEAGDAGLDAMAASLAPAREAVKRSGDAGERRRKNVLLGLAAAAAVIFVVAALIAARDSVVAALPGAAKAYAWLGLGGETLGAGLNIVDVGSARERSEAGETLVVTGAVTNVAAEPRPVPMIRVVLLDPDEEELQSAVVEPARPDLAPGERLDFAARIDRPAAAARRIKVTFLAREG
jgi:hypothetical protein